ncbi:DUF6365 family protein [Tissierella carlieri]|uniref:DUF6365 family protein n=1 Tax=Tissierella carlieri TaxID=689904 RepID=UPI002804BEC5|nr:DUF6365 family protein [uncultured Tissierella sp.]MDU5080196.1 DUF6365 family protein [Bacillota bacterium]
MKRILGVALGELSTGELVIAHSFAKGLNKNQYSMDFLISEEKNVFFEKDCEFRVHTISRNYGVTHNQRHIISIIKSNNYDLIILFDAFTMEYAQHWTGINMDVLKALDIPISSLDEYDYINAGYKLDYYGIFVKKLPDLLSEVDIILKNCPLSMPKGGQDLIKEAKKKGQFYYQVIQEVRKLDKNVIFNIRKRYVKDDEKIVFLTLSKWELEGAYSFTSQSTLCRYLLPLIYNYLSELDTKICLIHVGDSCWNESEFKNPKIKYIHYRSLPVDIFEELLQSSDLFVTYNLVSITLTKAVDFGVPSIVLNNDKIIDFKTLEKKCMEKPLWYQYMAKDLKKIYPFTASMFGWNHFLKGIMKDNIYMKSFERIQVFNTEQVNSTLKEILYGDLCEKMIDNINIFKRELSKVPNVNEVLNNAFQYLLELDEKRG